MDIIDFSQLLKFGAALAFVLALMALLGFAVKRFGMNQPLNVRRKRRLQVVEVLPLDARRKAVLLKRDDREHLVILGANSETVVESGIESQQDAEVVPLKKEA